MYITLKIVCHLLLTTDTIHFSDDENPSLLLLALACDYVEMWLVEAIDGWVYQCILQKLPDPTTGFLCAVCSPRVSYCVLVKTDKKDIPPSKHKSSSATFSQLVDPG